MLKSNGRRALGSNAYGCSVLTRRGTLRPAAAATLTKFRARALIVMTKGLQLER
jgi:hypothetical protein